MITTIKEEKPVRRMKLACSNPPGAVLWFANTEQELRGMGESGSIDSLEFEYSEIENHPQVDSRVVGDTVVFAKATNPGYVFLKSCDGRCDGPKAASRVLPHLRLHDVDVVGAELAVC